MRTIVFLSEKGGVGKSTACVNLAAVLGEMGRRVLIVDLDRNACASRALYGVAGFETSIGTSLIGRSPLTRMIQATPVAGVWIAPAASSLRAIVQMRLGPKEAPDRTDAEGRLMPTALRLELNRLGRNAFDYVLIDCPGGQEFMELLALLASDEVIVPTGISVFDLYALTPTLNLILEARRQRGNGAPRLLGLLPNGVTGRGVPEDFAAVLARHDAPVFSPIRHSAMLKSAPGKAKVEKRVITRFPAKSRVAESVRQVAREIDLGIEVARASAVESDPQGSAGSLQDQAANNSPR